MALRPHGGEEEQRVAVEGSGGEAPEEDVEEDGGAVGEASSTARAAGSAAHAA